MLSYLRSATSQNYWDFNRLPFSRWIFHVNSTRTIQSRNFWIATDLPASRGNYALWLVQEITGHASAFVGMYQFGIRVTSSR